MLWALGEQSPLSVRGQSMQDMVYTGGEGVGPSRYAEVEVILAADRGRDAALGFAEVSVQRRLDRAGEGEYRLNGARCRLVDVIDTLSDANLGGEMHSVISQGRVEEIVHSKPRHRRLLIEEAAGLGKHRKRRRRAQLRLERTQENLDRALDVEREARRRLRPLKQQAQAADIHTQARAGVERAAGQAARGRGRRRAQRSWPPPSAAPPKPVRHEKRSRPSSPSSPSAATEIEGRLAERDRERTEAWGRLTAIRAANERLAARADALAARREGMARELEHRQAALGAARGRARRGGRARRWRSRGRRA